MATTAFSSGTMSRRAVSPYLPLLPVSYLTENGNHQNISKPRSQLFHTELTQNCWLTWITLTGRALERPCKRGFQLFFSSFQSSDSWLKDERRWLCGTTLHAHKHTALVSHFLLPSSDFSPPATSFSANLETAGNFILWLVVPPKQNCRTSVPP